MRKAINSKRKFKYTKIGGENVERYAEEIQNLVDLAMEKKPLEFASEFHERMLGRIKEMLDPYREEIAHDLMKNEVDEEVEDPQNEDKAYKDMFKEREKFFKKKAKGMPKPFDKSHGLKSSRVEEVENDEEQLDELSKGTLKSYIKKANTGEKSGKRREGVNQAIGGVLGKDNFKKIFGKYQKEETEELDERDWSFKAEKATRNKNNTRSNMRQSPYTQRDRDNEKKIPMAKEEVEPLDELSKKTLNSYMGKAAPQVVKLAGDIKKNKGHNSKRTGAKFMSRLKGVSTAKTIVDDED